MERWVLILLCIALAGLMAFAAFTLREIQRGGIAVKLAGPLRIESSPQEGKLSVAIQGTVELVLNGSEGGELKARVEGALFPRCPGGILIPVRWNLLSGEIVWRCVAEDAASP
ncbi:hypothetical protein ACVNPS_06315 [Candidatus Bipolaricaulota sp. J31]